MIKLGRILISLLALVLAGCATYSSRDGARVPDWTSPEALPPVATAPAPALPPVPAAPPITGPTPPPVSQSLPAPVPAPTPAPTPAAVPVPERTNTAVVETWMPLNRWAQNNGLAAPRRVDGILPIAFALGSANGNMLLRAGSQLAYWDGLEVRLGVAPRWTGGQFLVSALDLKKSVEPLLQGPALEYPKCSPVVVIDAGHGGEDSGTRSVAGNHYEKDYTLDWALRLRRLLVAKGWQVLLTRTNDTNLALSNRVAVADQCKAGLFLSLHFNSAAPDIHQAGLETYCLTPVGLPSTVTRGFGDDLAAAFPNNAFDGENLQLATRVHRALLQINGHRDRGVRRARFLGVVRNQQRPAILIEGGYLSNPREARLIADPAYRQKLAEAVAGVLALESGLKGPETFAQAPTRAAAVPKNAAPASP